MIISREQVAAVKEATDIVAVVEAAGVSLQPVGGNKWKGLCCFHLEKTPSMIVDSFFQNFRCFGCGAQGDVFSFISKLKGFSFVEVLGQFAEAAGIRLDTAEKTPEERSRQLCRKITGEAADFFVAEYGKLAEDHVAKQEICSRHLSCENNAGIYGYAPASRTALVDFLRKAGYTSESIVTAGVGKRGPSGRLMDVWSARLMFIIRDVSGFPVGFSGKRLHDDAGGGKYVNSSGTPIFDKGVTLFHSDMARQSTFKEKLLYVVEGQFDVMAFREAGMFNVVAASGTAFSERQLNTCLRMVGPGGRIVFCLDGDTAGKKTLNKIFETYPAFLGELFTVTVPDGEDPCDIFGRLGIEGFKDFFMNNTRPLIEQVLDDKWGKETKTAEDVKNSVYNMAKMVASIRDRVLREEYARRVALKCGVAYDTMLGLISGEVIAGEEGKKKQAGNVKFTQSSSAEMTILQKVLMKRFALVLNRPDLLLPVVDYVHYSLGEQKLLKELETNFRENKKNIPENFTKPKQVAAVMGIQFPYLDLTRDSEVLKLYQTLTANIVKMRAKEEYDKRRAHALSVIANYDNLNSKLFAEIILVRDAKTQDFM